jgi:hypothetical protein
MGKPEQFVVKRLEPKEYSLFSEQGEVGRKFRAGGDHGWEVQPSRAYLYILSFVARGKGGWGREGASYAQLATRGLEGGGTHIHTRTASFHYSSIPTT